MNSFLLLHIPGLYIDNSHNLTIDILEIAMCDSSLNREQFEKIENFLEEIFNYLKPTFEKFLHEPMTYYNLLSLESIVKSQLYQWLIG